MVFDPNFVWLIQRNQDDRLAAPMIQEALDELGVRWIDIEIDFEARTLPRLPALNPADRVLCHGPSFIPRIEHAAPIWRIGSIFDPATFRWSQYQRHWPEHMMSPDGRVLTVHEFRQDMPRASMFTRPDADSKKFDGSVRSVAQIAELLDGLDADMQVMMAEPVPIDAEYRVFIVGGEVVGASEYRRQGVPSIQGFVPNAVVDLALLADGQWRPADAYVIDIALASGRLGIVEANCITAARFYAVQPKAVVAALCRYYGMPRREPVV